MLEHLKQTKRGNYGPGHCKVRRMIELLEEVDREILLECLADRDAYSTYGIWQGLRAANLDIGHTSLARHRDGVCPCGGSNA